MKKIVIIGANSFQEPLIQRAKEMGFETHAFAWREGAVGARTADFFYPVSITEIPCILEKCREIGPVAITSAGSDLAMLTVNDIAQKLGLPGNSMESTLAATNKYRMREAFAQAGIPVPQFRLADRQTDSGALRELSLPVIVKPTDRSGSRAITKLESWEGLKEALEKAMENSFEKKAIVEECLQGQEYSCECISFQGQHHCLAITKKYTTGTPHFIETGHLQPAGLTEEQRKNVQEMVFRGLDALEVKTGASHSEFMLDDTGAVRLIEIGPRMGGDCIGSDLVLLSAGYDYLGMVIQTACGLPPELRQVRQPQAACIRFVFGQEDLELLHRIQREKPELIWRVSDMEPITDREVTDSSTRFGFFILKAGHEEAIKEYLDL